MTGSDNSTSGTASEFEYPIGSPRSKQNAICYYVLSVSFGHIYLYLYIYIYIYIYVYMALYEYIYGGICCFEMCLFRNVVTGFQTICLIQTNIALELKTYIVAAQ